MNATARTASDRDTLRGMFVAELTTAAYAVALRHGTAYSWLDLQLDLWKALNETVICWEQGCPAEENSGRGTAGGTSASIPVDGTTVVAPRARACGRESAPGRPVAGHRPADHPPEA